MRREQQGIWFDGAPVDTTSFREEMERWFLTQASTGKLAQSTVWLLIHTEAGVIWGRVWNGALYLSNGAFPAVSPPLAPHTLWEARLFGAKAQVHLWRTADGFAAWRIEEQAIEQAPPPHGFVFDEWQRLWGTKIVDVSPAGEGDRAQQPRFTLIADGEQGLLHAVPLLVPANAMVASAEHPRYRPLRLCTRSYVRYDDGGRARIVANRLVEVHF